MFISFHFFLFFYVCVYVCMYVEGMYPWLKGGLGIFILHILLSFYDSSWSCLHRSLIWLWASWFHLIPSAYFLIWVIDGPKERVHGTHFIEALFFFNITPMTLWKKSKLFKTKKPKNLFKTKKKKKTTVYLFGYLLDTQSQNFQLFLRTTFFIIAAGASLSWSAFFGKFWNNVRFVFNSLLKKV